MRRLTQLKFDLTDDVHTFGHCAVLTWGSYLKFALTMVLYDKAFIQQYLQITYDWQDTYDWQAVEFYSVRRGAV